MKTTDLFKSNRSAKRLNESLEKTFGTKINFEDFDTPKLEDARNKLRTQIHDARSQSGFNETIENETLTKAQWMHDAIVAELMDREEHIVDTSVQEGGTFDTQEVVDVLKKFDENMNERGGYGDPDYDKILDALHNYDVESAIDEVWNAYSDQDGGEIDMYDAIKDLEDEFKFLVHSNPSQRVRSTQQSSSFGNKEGGDDFDDPDNPKNWGGDHNDQAAYDDRRKKEEVEMEGGREMTGTARDRFISTMTPRMDNDALMQKVAKVVNSPEFTEDTILKIVDAGNTVTHPVARYIQKEFEELQYDLGREYEDYPERVAEKLLAMLIDRTKQGVSEGDQDWMADMRAMAHKMAPQDKMRERQAERDAQAKSERQQKIQQDIDNLPDLMSKYKDMESEYESMGGKNWQYADSEQNLSDEERRARNMETSMRQLADRIHTAKKASEGKKENINTNEAYINNAKDAINILADIRKQSKMAELGQGEPVRPNQLVNDLWDVMQWIEANMEESFENESIETTGDNMSNLREGEIQQASAIVTAKTMVDRVGRWIEELSGMENDTLLQLGDSIRDEMGQEQSKAFIQAVAPAIQQALETLKVTRDTLSTGVRSLASGEQPADMLGAEPTGMGGAEMAAEPDAMNMGDEMGGEDEFAAAEPAAGGIGDAGREQRESINRSNSLLKALAG